MKPNQVLRIASLLAVTIAWVPAIASDAALAKLQDCMKLKAASNEQQACLKEVQGLRAQPQAMAKSKSVAAAPPKAKSTAAAGAPPKVIDVPPEIKAAAATLHVNGATPVGGIGGGIAIKDIKGLDLETAMMAVQAQRGDLLEAQLKGQLDAISKRNNDLTAMNRLLDDLKRMRPAGPDKEKWGNLGANTAEGKANYARLKAAGVTFPTGGDVVDEPGTGIYDAKQKTFDAWAEQIKGKVDSLISTQQMDMLRMQSLTNKRNEAFELMTNFVKKMADSRSSVLGNMR